MMYIDLMTRIWINVDEAMLNRLRILARVQGREIADLIRDAIDSAYGTGMAQRAATVRAVAGIWRDRSDLGSTSEYVRNLRRDTRPERRKD